MPDHATPRDRAAGVTGCIRCRWSCGLENDPIKTSVIDHRVTQAGRSIRRSLIQPLSSAQVAQSFIQSASIISMDGDCTASLAVGSNG